MAWKQLYRSLPLALLAPYAAYAQTTALERFTHGIVTLYTASEKCRAVSSLHSENYTIIIKNYLGAYYHETIPYWALPNVAERVSDRNECLFLIGEGLLFYQTSSVDFAANYPQLPPPPPLSAATMNAAIAPSAEGGYHVTPPVLTR